MKILQRDWLLVRGKAVLKIAYTRKTYLNAYYQRCRLLVMDFWYLKTKCAVKNGNKRSSFFDYNRGVRQGCILSPILFNLYLDEFPRLLESSRDTDSIILPNGLPLNCLFYADDLILISRSAAGLQKQLNILHSYSEKWLLKINLKKTKTLIFQKQNRKSTRDWGISSLSF